MSPNEPSPPLSLDDVKDHNTRGDCWIIVHSKVFDITDYIHSHPGGPSIILSHAGTDATKAYDEIHAPGIIEETLSAEKFKGTISDTELSRLPPNETRHAKRPLEVADKKDLTGQYVKPEIHKIISVYDFEEVARHTFSPKAWAFYSSASNDLLTHYANSDFYQKVMFRPRVLRDVTHANTKRSILGVPTTAPFFVSPAAMARLAHPDGECAIAKGCEAEGLIQAISSNASYPLSAITSSTRTPNQPFFFQLYVNTDRAQTARLLQHARSLGVKAILLTVDVPVPSKREADERVSADESIVSESSGTAASNDKKGGGMGRLMGAYIDRSLKWTDIPWIKEKSGGLPVVIKGIQSAADAKLAMAYAVDGIMISNHGGRSLDTTQPAILTLLELHRHCPSIFHTMDILLDGGISRGSDILKALCLGARAVGVGRPFLYSLAYGEEGVRHLCQILKDELETAMRLCGITDVEDAGPELVNTRALDSLVVDGDGEGHPWIGWRPKARM